MQTYTVLLLLLLLLLLPMLLMLLPPLLLLSQLDVAERGFSFAADGPIDMRLGPSAGSSAEELVNTASEAQLGAIIRDYGEEKSWKAVARRWVGGA
jgi:hypothetical protein